MAFETLEMIMRLLSSLSLKVEAGLLQLQDAIDVEAKECRNRVQVKVCF